MRKIRKHESYATLLRIESCRYVDKKLLLNVSVKHIFYFVLRTFNGSHLFESRE